MNKIIVEGGIKLNGEIKISGSKNAALPIIVAALLTNGKSRFFNVPKLDDINNTISLLETLGVSIKMNKNTVCIDPSGLNSYKAPYDLVRKMRASILILGPLLARLKKAKIPLPGGCSIGARPINLHLKALKQLGVKIEFKKGYVNAYTKNLIGGDIYFDTKTVTGTENLVMASVLANGVTTLRNAACEPEVVALIKVLNKMGANIHGAGSSKVIIRGVKKLNPVEEFIIPDRVETGTFMIAAAITQGDVKILNCEPKNLIAVINKLKKTGTKVDFTDNSIHVKGTSNILSVDLKTLPYPGFPTDMQAPFMTLMSVANGLSIISETIFENRFIHVKELNNMGANISIQGRNAIVRGVKVLSGKKVIASDLRASASLILAGLVAKGKTEITGLNHLDRGYESIEKKIMSLGGIITRIKI